MKLDAGGNKIQHLTLVLHHHHHHHHHHHILFFACSIASAAAFTFTFTPRDNILLNCGGSSALTLDDGRTFRPDDAGARAPSSFLFSPVSHTTSSTSTSSVIRTNSSKLYGSARVFTEATEYKLGIAQKGRHLLRLHFYPIPNAPYDLKSALFSVSADSYQLLYNFSTSKLAIKEYIIDAGSKQLMLKISPWVASFAFINAIEVISIPDSLVPSVASPVPPARAAAVDISTRIAFETMYRLNVGGPALTSANDSLWRVWENDSPFLINPASVHIVSTRPDSIRYPSSASEYAAPSLVYATANEMADANVGNQKFNISWLFKVDSGFRYLVRLHFCDFFNKLDRHFLFNVYINNQSALSSFDILNKVGLSTAYFMDFVIDVQTNLDRILAQVGPSQLTNVQPNAILNGLEIMKLSNSKDGFDMAHTTNIIGVEMTKKKTKAVLIIAICLGASVFLAFIVAVLFIHLQRQKRKKKQADNWFPSPITLTTHIDQSETKISGRSFSSSVPALGLGQLFSFCEIQEATKNFDEDLVIGVGGFGKVYQGLLENGLVVAVKRGNPRSQQGLTEFRTEIEMLSKLRHRHLVSLIGYCDEANEMVLVYEFMAGGSLREHLYGSDLPALSWKQRLEICIDAAKGLHYLHTGAAETIIHRDVKTTNILLDENLTAKVADFGLSKSGTSLDQTHVSTAVKGSFGYLDPEYFRRQRLTEKSDVYSFGVVMLEVLCARPAINPALPRDQVNIVEWAMDCQKRGQLERIIDPHLVGTVSLDSLRKFGGTAEKCLAEHGNERPTMGDVLWNLEYALQLQEFYTSVAEEGSSTNAIKELPEWISQVESSENDSFSVLCDRTDVLPSRVFSQLMDPKGR